MTPIKWMAAAVVVAAVVGLPMLAKQSRPENKPAAAAVPVEASATAGTAGTAGTAAGAATTTGACGNGDQSAAVSCGALPPLPRFVDLGTTTCAPCKAMLSVMNELEQQFPEALSVEFINIKDDPDAMGRYGARMIPTQIFLSPDGKEIFRHTGVMQTQAVVAKWRELGYDLVASSDGRR